MLERREVRLVIPDEGLTQDGVSVVALGAHRYRVESTVVSDALHFGDIIEADMGTGGAVVFQRVLSPSAFKAYEYALPPSMIASQPFREILDSLAGVGGTYEILFGGCVFLYVPQTASFDPTMPIASLQRTPEGGSDDPDKDN